MENFKINFIEFKNNFNIFRNIVTRGGGTMGVGISRENFYKGLEDEYIDMLHIRGPNGAAAAATAAIYWNNIQSKLLRSRDNLLGDVDNDKSIKFVLTQLDSNTPKSEELRASLSNLISTPDDVTAQGGDLLLFKEWGIDVFGSIGDTEISNYDRAFDAFDNYMVGDEESKGIFRRKSRRRRSRRRKSRRRKSRRRRSHRRRGPHNKTKHKKEKHKKEKHKKDKIMEIKKYLVF